MSAAFPHDIGRGKGGFADCDDGLTKREYAAIHILAGMAAGSGWTDNFVMDQTALKNTIVVAIAATDALLAELEKGKQI